MLRYFSLSGVFPENQRQSKKPRSGGPFRGWDLIDLTNYFIRIIFLVLLYLPANIL